MKKLSFLILMVLFLVPSAVDAEVYTTEEMPCNGQNPTRTSTYVNVKLHKTTGVLTLSYFGKAGSMEVTISQNGAVIENDVIAVSNGQSVIYNLSGYAIGDYLLTIETANGEVKQYIIHVEDD